MNSDPKSIKIIAPDGSSETVFGEQVGTDAYKLLENPIFNSRINYGTTVKVTTDKNGELVVSKILRASEYKTRRFLLSSFINQTDLKEKIGNRIIEAGGTWEVAMGGLAFVHIPKDSAFDLDELFREQGYFPTEIIDDEKDGT